MVPQARRDTWELLDELRGDGVTIVLTTHYMEEAERLADRIVVLADGAVRAEGSPSTLGARDRAAATVRFTLPAGAVLPRDLAARAAAERGRVELRSSAPMTDLHALAGWALEGGFELGDIEVRRPTLEDVYLDLTTRTAGSVS
jgi:ABC-2 type transport system ATP-binding protein